MVSSVIKASVNHRGLEECGESEEEGGEEEGGEEEGGESSRISGCHGGVFLKPAAIDRKFDYFN